MTLDKIFAECKQLNNDDFETLLNGMLTEQKDRQDREKQKAWDAVWSAICTYTNRYGDITLFTNNLGYRQLALNADSGFHSISTGKIELL